MPEPLKYMYNKELLTSFCKELKRLKKGFDVSGFMNHVFDAQWDQRELKDRMGHIAVALHEFLPKKYSQAINILMKASPMFSGFEFMFFPDFVERYGLEEFDISVSALEHFTKCSSSEFAVRPFIIRYQVKMMKQMKVWAKSRDRHVRRLASEGCRPRLPWAMALPEFKKDPAPVLRILELLKNDESEYVRRSVANNLNDISKDHPKIVIERATSWLGHNSNTDWVVKHACRTLLKQGAPEVMALFGFAKPTHIRIKNFDVQSSVKLGAKFAFSFTLKAQKQKLGKLRIEYALDFMKKNGKPSRKLFTISESETSDKEKTVARAHSFRKITTRKYYAGRHGIAIIINGHELAHKNFVVN